MNDKNMDQIPPERISFNRPLKDVLEQGGALEVTVVDDDGITHTSTIDESDMTVNGEPLAER